ncbi:hypothetical protein [Pseudomonas piscis]|uniref:Uncharacterized protein n=1 Tax=Pseudomonas piscis TaxID=2614538 RepID=A0A7X1PNS9_9PSED|nr:hypothetical protein [Pseudomonas piscis]MQA55629.1 hypothetical protein [Pseudomonas piscis]
MNIRSQVERLRRQVAKSSFNEDVKQISDLMDELSANAAGSELPHRNQTLQDILDEYQSSTVAEPGRHLKESS